MQTMIQNIFMDQKSYELIQKNQDFEHICSVILNGVDTDKPQPQTIIINKIAFQAEFHPKNDYFGFTFTKKKDTIISAMKSVGLKNSVYIYSPTAMEEYDEDFPGATLLLYTTKKHIYVTPYGENGLSKMDSSTGKFYSEIIICMTFCLLCITTS